MFARCRSTVFALIVSRSAISRVLAFGDQLDHFGLARGQRAAFGVARRCASLEVVADDRAPAPGR